MTLIGRCRGGGIQKNRERRELRIKDCSTDTRGMGDDLLARRGRKCRRVGRDHLMRKGCKVLGACDSIEGEEGRSMAGREMNRG